MSVHCIFGDSQIHPFKQFATGSGINNSRLQTTLKVIDGIRNFCLANGITSAIHLGDVFESRIATRYEHFNPAFETFKKFKEDGIKLTILMGNHDMVDKSGEVTTIDTFSEFATIIKKPAIDGSLCFLPYFRDPEYVGQIVSQSDSSKFLLAHIDVLGARVAHGWESDKGIKRDLLSGYRCVLMGHFHLRQTVTEGIYFIGCCCPQSFSEVGEPGYFVTLDDETGEVTWYTTSAPKFLVHDPKNAFTSSMFEGNYVKWLGNPGSDVDKLLEKAAGYICSPTPAKVHVVPREKGISLDTNLDQVVEKYARVHKGDFHIDELIRVGKELLVE